METKYKIKLDASKNLPLYMQIAEHIKSLITSGEIKPGEKLLPIRKLAAELDVNPITVVNACKYLEEQELASSRVGSGTYVTYRKSQQKHKLQLQTAAIYSWK